MQCYDYLLNNSMSSVEAPPFAGMVPLVADIGQGQPIVYRFKFRSRKREVSQARRTRGFRYPAEMIGPC